jgi:hypothetical protein
MTHSKKRKEVEDILVNNGLKIGREMEVWRLFWSGQSIP